MTTLINYLIKASQEKLAKKREILLCVIISYPQNTVLQIHYCKNIWKCMAYIYAKSQSHEFKFAVENNSRIFFFLLAFNSEDIWNLEEHRAFISVVRGLYCLIAISVITEKSNHMLSQIKGNASSPKILNQSHNIWLFFVYL